MRKIKDIQADIKDTKRYLREIEDIHIPGHPHGEDGTGDRRKIIFDQAWAVRKEIEVLERELEQVRQVRAEKKGKRTF